MSNADLDFHLIAPAEVAEQLGIRETTLSIWRATGRQELPYVKIGRLVKYRQSDVNQYIRSRIRGCTHGTNVHDAVLQRAA